MMVGESGTGHLVLTQWNEWGMLGMMMDDVI